MLRVRFVLRRRRARASALALAFVALVVLAPMWMPRAAAADPDAEPSLRMISAAGPYMHNGVFATLDEVLDFYHNIPVTDPLLEGDVEPPLGGAAARSTSAVRRCVRTSRGAARSSWS